MRGDDNMFHIHGKKYELLKGSRTQVWNGTAYKTKGDLKRNDLLKNKHGRYVSKKKSRTAKKEKRLEQHGFFAKKGKFGYVKKSVKSPKKTRKAKKTKRRARK